MMEEKKGEYKILFVCLGNICRSPSAEAVMKKLVQDAGLDGRIKIDSAGIIGYHAGEKADPRMRSHAARRWYFPYQMDWFFIRVCARMRPVGDIS